MTNEELRAREAQIESDYETRRQIAYGLVVVSSFVLVFVVIEMGIAIGGIIEWGPDYCHAQGWECGK